MTDNEIIKALECCGPKQNRRCGICPAYDLGNFCASELKQNALDLINRLQENNQKSSAGSSVNSLLDTINGLILERSNLIVENNHLQAENREHLAEIERLKPFEDKIAEFNSHIRVEDMLVFASSLEEWLEFCDSLKAEAYKEFAERLKKEQYLSIVDMVVSVTAINNLLKELMGENND